jgi:hypothetical protein
LLLLLLCLLLMLMLLMLDPGRLYLLAKENSRACD